MERYKIAYFLSLAMAEILPTRRKTLFNQSIIEHKLKPPQPDNGHYNASIKTSV